VVKKRKIPLDSSLHVSNMLLFQNELEVENWAIRQNTPEGDLQPIGKIWEFSKVIPH
jgi:hypothetical protein